MFSLKKSGVNARSIAILISSASVDPCPSAVQTQTGWFVFAETKRTVTNMQELDNLLEHRHGLSNSTMNGANNKSISNKNRYI